MIILWHKNDLRLSDNKALSEAIEKSDQILPLYIYDSNQKSWPLGETSRWWLLHALKDLRSQYQEIGGDLFFKEGEPLEVFKQIIKSHSVEALYLNLSFDPSSLKECLEIKQKLEKEGVEVKFFNSNYVINPENFLNKSSEPFQVFTPFYNGVLKTLSLNFSLVPKPKAIKVPKNFKGDKLEDFSLLPKIHWYKKLEKRWNPTRKAIKELLDDFSKCVHKYTHDRDFPAIDATSRMSPYLHFGQISPKEVIVYLIKKTSEDKVAPFFRQLVWREFGMYFLYHFPHVAEKNWREKFDHFPWKKSKSLFDKWKKGETGYPIVDAGMKQLWETGWMHNRVRMIVASFLIKDLMIHWREGAEWFWNTLVDADLANNTLGWQWVAGSGPDASPFFRIFNPILQGEKFDPEGEYVKRYLPALKNVPKEWIHKPWEAPMHVLKNADVTLGSDYPHPIVDHNEKRVEAMNAYKSL